MCQQIFGEIETQAFLNLYFQCFKLKNCENLL